MDVADLVLAVLVFVAACFAIFVTNGEPLPHSGEKDDLWRILILQVC